MESKQLFPLMSEKISVSRLIGTTYLKKYKKGQITYKGLGAIRSANGLRLLSSHRKSRLVTLTTGINIPSLHGNTACCTVALAS